MSETFLSVGMVVELKSRYFGYGLKTEGRDILLYKRNKVG